MNVLVAYATRLGSTRGIAERIADQLTADGFTGTAIPVETVTHLGAYDAFIVGSAVYERRWLPAAGRFVEDNRAVLASHPAWFFSSGPVGGTATAAEPVRPSGIDALARSISAREHRIFAGALDRSTLEDSDLGPVERFIAKRFVPEGDFRAWPEIDAWVAGIARELSAAPAGRR